MDIEIDDLFVPTLRDSAGKISWKSSLYYIVYKIHYGFYASEDNPNGISSCEFINEKGKVFQEGFYFIDNLIENKHILKINDDAVKAKLVLVGDKDEN